MTLTASAKLAPKSKTKHKSGDWVVINAGKGGRFECLRCGDSYLPRYPAPVSVVSKISKAFALDHARCELHADGLCCCHCGKRGHQPNACPSLQTNDPHEWLRGSDTGTSSKTIWRVMMGVQALPNERDDVPLDPSDLGRCLRLLKLFPGWRARLGEMSKVRGWAPLVKHWQEMEKLYAEEEPSGRAPKLYALMQRLERGADL